MTIYSVEVPVDSVIDDVEELRRQVTEQLPPGAKVLVTQGCTLKAVSPYTFTETLKSGDSEITTSVSFATHHEMMMYIYQFKQDKETPVHAGEAAMQGFTNSPTRKMDAQLDPVADFFERVQKSS